MPRTLGLLLASTALCTPALAQELPTGGSVAAGGATIGAPSGGAMDITQTTPQAVLNWDSFSIGAGGSVSIQQPSADSAMLNRVTGAVPSTLDGTLTANGQVFLVNRNGVLVGPSGRVEAGGFAASTLDIADDDFMNGNLEFRGNGQSGRVSNEGVIEIHQGGFAALLGGRVSNSGVVRVPMGRVGFGAGEQATLDLTGDGFLQIAVPSKDDGDDEALITNSGRVEADGGFVTMQAAAARDAVRNTINLSGVVEARTVSGRNGAVVLGGGGGGKVKVTGRVTASAPRAPVIVVDPVDVSPRPAGNPERGGDITITGAEIELDGAVLDVSGAGGGGSIRVGGDYQGGGDLPTARETRVSSSALLLADALEDGNGGTVIVWSDELTVFQGSISAKGGPEGGDGGFAEVSGKALLSYGGISDLTAPLGQVGDLLLDPFDVTISTDPDSNFDIAVGQPTGTPSNVNVTGLIANLETANVTISTAGGGTEEGLIDVQAPILWTSPTTLTLIAEGRILIDAPIQNITGGLSLSSGSTISATGDINVFNFFLAGGSWEQNTAILPQFENTQFSFSEGTGFLRATGGTGTDLDPFILTDIYGLQGMGSDPLLDQSFALGNDIIASDTMNWSFDGLSTGFDPIGRSDGTAFTGSLDGRGFAVDQLTVDNATAVSVGLFGAIGTGGTVSNLNLTNLDVTGTGANTGGVAGLNQGTVSGVSAQGDVAGQDSGIGSVGGIAGNNEGVVSNSDFAGTVTATDDLLGSGGSASVNVGGAAGVNSGTLDTVTTAGTTTLAYSGAGFGSFATAGGVAGLNSGTISNSAGAMAVVTTDSSFNATILAGGAAGQNSGAISDTSVINALTVTPGSNTSDYFVGGVAGANLNIGVAPTLTNVDSGGSIDVLGAAEDLAAGGVVGVLQGSANDVSFNGSLLIEGSVTGGASVGGVAGAIDGTASIDTAVEAAGSLAVDMTGNLAFGRIVGVSDGTITNADAGQGLADADITAAGNQLAVGGVAGQNFGPLTSVTNDGDLNVTFNDSVSTGKTARIGGIVGDNKAPVDQAVSTGTVRYGGDASDGSILIGGVVGLNDATTVTNSSTETANGDVVVVMGGTSNTFNVGGVAGQSNLFSNGGFDNVSANDGLVNVTGTADQVKVGGVVGVAGGTNTNLTFGGRIVVDAEASILEFISIGGVIGELNAFGTLDGAVEAAFGLTASTRGELAFGGIVGENFGTVSNVETGQLRGQYDVTAEAISGLAGNIGGVIGYNDGSLSVAQTDTGDFTVNLINAAGATASVGGVTGLNDTGASVTDALSRTGIQVIGVASELDAGGVIGTNRGTLTRGGFTTESGAQPVLEVSNTGGLGNYHVGGVIGHQFGTATDSYATGDVTLTSNGDEAFVGGYAGEVEAATAITRSFASGAVTLNYSGLGTSQAGGHTAVANGGTIAESYWDTERSGQLVSAGGDPLTTAELQDPDSFIASAGVSALNADGWDFETVWAPGDSDTGDDPALYSIIPVIFADVDQPASLTYGETDSLVATGNTFGGPALYVFSDDTVDTTGLFVSNLPPEADVGTYTAGAASATLTSDTDGTVYRLVVTEKDFDVLPAPLTITANDQAKEYGETLDFAALTLDEQVTVVGLQFDDAVTGVDLASDGAAADADVVAGGYAITFGSSPLAGDNPANYTITLVDGTLTVTPAPLTITANDQTKEYGDELDLAALTLDEQVTVTGLKLDDAVSGVVLASDGAPAEADVDPAGYAITVGGTPVAGDNPANYTITLADGTLTVTPAPLTITANDQTKEYGDALDLDTLGLAQQVTAEGLKNDDALTSATLSSAGEPATSDVGDFAISIDTVVFDQSANYTIALADGTLTVTPAPLTVTANDQTKEYGDALDLDALTLGDQVTIDGLKNTDGVTSASLSSGGEAATADAGDFAIAVDSLVFDQSANYTITLVDGTLTVTPAPLTITANDQTKEYGDELDLAALTQNEQVTVTGLKLSDTVDGVVLASDGAAEDADVIAGGYAITVDSATVSGDNGGNYTITLADGTLTVTPAPLTITANDQTKEYGDALDLAALTLDEQVTVDGLKLDDAVTGVELASLGADAAADVVAGGYAITVGGTPVAGGNAANYTITVADGVLTVTPAPLTIAANDQTKEYGDALDLAALTLDEQVTVTGLKLSDTVSGVELASDGAAEDADVVGDGYAITVGGTPVAGGNAANYLITLENGTLTVTPAPLTITANDQTKEYGDALDLAALPQDEQITVTGLKLDDAVTGVDLASDGAAEDADVEADGYAITVGGTPAAGDNAANYTISLVNGTLTVTPAPVTITANNQAKEYGDALDLAALTLDEQVTVTGLKLDDAVSGVTVASDGAAEDADVMADGYAITVGGTPVVGDNAANYTISLVNGTLTVTPAPLTITANDQTKEYGDALDLAALTLDEQVTVTGLKLSDTVDGVELASDGAAEDADVDADGYAIAVGGTPVAGGNAANYTISLVNGTLTVTPAPLTITANDQSKEYGDALDLAALTTDEQVTVTGLKLTDTVAGISLSSDGTEAEADVLTGGYGVTFDGTPVAGGNAANYTITVVDGTLTVTPAPLTITATDQDKLEGEDADLGTTDFTVAGLKNADTVTAVTLESTGAPAGASPTGSPYAIVASAPTGDGLTGPGGESNYAITFEAGLLAVTSETPATSTPRNLPPPPVPNAPRGGLPNPPDALDLSFVLDEDAAPSPINVSSSVTAVAAAREGLAVVEAGSAVLVEAAANCRQTGDSATGYLACLVDAFGEYSEALNEAAEDLPPEMRTVAGIIVDLRDEIAAVRASAEIRLAVAPTPAARRAIEVEAIGQARAAIASAQTQIRNTIDLIRADDPELTAIQIQASNVVIDALGAVDTELVRAIDL